MANISVKNRSARKLPPPWTCRPKLLLGLLVPSAGTSKVFEYFFRILWLNLSLKSAKISNFFSRFIFPKFEPFIGCLSYIKYFSTSFPNFANKLTRESVNISNFFFLIFLKQILNLYKVRLFGDFQIFLVTLCQNRWSL